MTTLTASGVTIALPNPHFNDSEGLIHDINIVRTLGGGIYTYVKNKDRRRLIMEFRISFSTAQELQYFIKINISNEIVLRDFIGQHWTGHLMNNPFEFEGLKDDDQNIQIVFEGVKS